MPKVYIIGEGLEPIAKFGFKLSQCEIKIGRSDKNHIIIDDDDSISSEHCVIRRVFGGYIIKDLESENGISQNGKKTTKAQIKNASMFHVGDSEIRFTLDKTEISDLAKEPQEPAVYVEESQLESLDELHNGEIDELPFDLYEELDDEEDEDEVIELDDEEEEESSASPLLTGNAAVVRPSLGVSTAGAAPAVGAVGGVSRSSTYAKKKPSLAVPLVIALILAAVGFVGGLYLNHYNQRGGNLFEDISEKRLR